MSGTSAASAGGAFVAVACGTEGVRVSAHSSGASLPNALLAWIERVDCATGRLNGGGWSAGLAEAAGRLRSGGHLADREVARDPAQAAVGGDLQPLGIAVLQAGADPLDDVLRRL